jgi:hypothetical protein
MVRRIAPIGVVSFVLLATCGADCQSPDQSLPDAPSVQIAAGTQGFNIPEKFRISRVGATGGAEHPLAAGGFSPIDKRFSRKDSSTVFDKYLSPSSVKLRSAYQLSGSGTLMGRATYAASRTFVRQDETGKGRLNTSYLLRALTSVAAETASRPYWRRSGAQPFSDFGSTVGNDAGMNLLHEFAPNLQEVMKSHAPRFVSNLAARIGRN